MLGERWIRGHEEGVELACSPQRQSRANTSTLGWRVRHGGEEGGQSRVGNYRGPEKRGL